MLLVYTCRSGRLLRRRAFKRAEMAANSNRGGEGASAKWLDWEPAALIQQCEVDLYRASGLGGRNATNLGRSSATARPD